VVVVEPLNPFSQGLEHVNRRIGATVAELNDLNGVKRLNVWNVLNGPRYLSLRAPVISCLNSRREIA